MRNILHENNFCCCCRYRCWFWWIVLSFIVFNRSLYIMEKKMTQKAKTQKCQRAFQYRQSQKKAVSPYSTVVVSLDGSTKKVFWEQQQALAENKEKKEKASVVITLPRKTEGMATKGTQTDYRESETQTVPWRHEVKAEKNTLQQLLSLDWLNLEEHFPMGMSEVRQIEFIQQQLAWEDILKGLRGAENEGRRRRLVVRTAEAATKEKERRKEEEDRERMEIVRKEMKAKREAEEEKLQWKMMRAYYWRRKENDAKIQYWKHQTTRKIRKMKSARSQSAKKQDIIAIHKDKASEIYAPKLRDGENPSLGHEVIEIQCRYLKRYHGLEILEKHLKNITHPKIISKSRFRPQTSTSKKTELCMRKFRERAMEEPTEMKFSGLSLKIPVPPPTPGDSTPVASRPLSDSEETLEMASLLLKKLIKGRAVQTQKYMQIFKMASA